jgi:tRNA-dihydrouridine synthase
LPAPTLQQRIDVIRQHLHGSVAWKGPRVGITEMRRHYSNYLKGLPNIKDYRYRLVTLDTVEEIEAVLDEVAQRYDGFEFQKARIELINYHEKCAV